MNTPERIIFGMPQPGLRHFEGIEFGTNGMQATQETPGLLLQEWILYKALCKLAAFPQSVPQLPQQQTAFRPFVFRRH